MTTKISEEHSGEHPMRKVTFSFSQFWGMVLLLGIMVAPFSATALEPEPHPLDTFLTNILTFKSRPAYAAQSDTLTKLNRLSG